MGEKIYHTVVIAGAKIRVPSSVSLEPLELLYRVHGIDLKSGTYSCPSCGTVIDQHTIPWNKVCGCGRPFEHRCAARGCDTILNPELHDGSWYQPQPFCGQCVDDTIRDERQRLVDEIPTCTLAMPSTAGARCSTGRVSSMQARSGCALLSSRGRATGSSTFTAA